MTELRFTLFGRPHSWARDNWVRGRMIQDSRTREGKAALAAAAHASLLADSGAARASRIDDDGHWAVRVAAYYPNGVQGDADRVLTLVLDALQGIAYATDRQVKRASIEVYVDRDDPRTEVHAYRFDM